MGSLHVMSNIKSEFEEWFKTTEAYKLIEEMNYFKVDLFTFKEHRSQYQHSAVQIAYMTYQHQQSKVDELNQELHLVLNNWNDLTNAIHARTNGTAVAEARQLYEKVDELQKRVDSTLKVVQSMRIEVNHGHMSDEEVQMLSSFADELEQALKGSSDETN